MNSRSISALLGLAVVIVCLVVGGCSGSLTGKLSGVVTLDGKPVSDAQVQFVTKDSDKPSEIRMASGKTDADGKFEILLGPSYGQQLTPGDYVVLVSKYVDKDGKVQQGDIEGGLDLDQLKSSGDVKNVVPQGYSEMESSDIFVDIKSANQEGIQIKLKKSGPVLGAGGMP